MSLGRESWLLVVLPAAVLGAAFWALRPSASDVGRPLDDRPAPPVRPPSEAPAETESPAPPSAVAGSSRAPETAVADESDLVVAATLPGVWTATVVDAAGRSVSGARVRIRRLPSTSFDGDLPLNPSEVYFEDGFTDEFGRVDVACHAGWRFDVVVEAPGHGRLFVSDHAASDTLVLPAPRDFSGRVVDADNRPVADAVVRIFDGPRDPLEVRTDADGRYVVRGAATAPTVVEVRHRDFGVEAQSVRTSDEPTANFRLAPGATVSAGVSSDGATATAAAAAAAPAAPTNVGGEGGAAAPAAPTPPAAEPGAAYLFDRWTRTLHERVDLDASGRIDFGGLTLGRDYLVAVRRGGRSGEAVFRGGDAFPDVALEAAPELNVVVEDEAGRPVEGAAVTLRRFDGLPFDDSPAAYTGFDGCAQAPAARAGVRFRIVVYRHGFAAAERRDVTLAAGERRTESFRLRPAVPFSGFAMGTDGRPLAGALVRVTRSDRFGAPPLFGYVAADGSFSLAGVAEGDVTVLVLTAGYAVVRDRLSVGPTGNAGLLLLRDRDAANPFTRR